MCSLLFPPLECQLFEGGDAICLICGYVTTPCNRPWQIQMLNKIFVDWMTLFDWFLFILHFSLTLNITSIERTSLILLSRLFPPSPLHHSSSLHPVYLVNIYHNLELHIYLLVCSCPHCNVSSARVGIRLLTFDPFWAMKMSIT